VPAADRGEEVSAELRVTRGDPLEREALLDELCAAARGKSASSDAERARLAATKGIEARQDRGEPSGARRAIRSSGKPEPRIASPHMALRRVPERLHSP
jgi:hypothetical protein